MTIMMNDKKALVREARRRNIFPSRKKIMLMTATLFSVWLIYCGFKFKRLVNSKIATRRQVEDIIQDPKWQLKRLPDPRGNVTKLVILWTPFFSQTNYVLPLERYSCQHTNCNFTSNKKLIREADAVMFHARDTSLFELPKYRRADQRWILLHHEAPPSTPPHLMEGLSGLINWTVTYRTDSDVVLTPKYSRRKTLNKKINYPSNVSANKKRLVAWFVSNCKTDSRREEFVQELRKTVTIDVFGSCGPFTCHPKMSQKCYQTIGREYHFYLSLENAICKDYVTEKLFNILDHNIVPIAFGGVNQAAFLPPDSFIDIFDFKSTADLGQYLIRLTKDHEAYDRYFRWKAEYEMEPYQHYACQICGKLNSDQELAKSWTNLSRWWHEESECRTWSAMDSD